MTSVATAFAAGGSGISGAAAVVWGQQHFGNTATDGIPPGSTTPSNKSWWSLNVLAGDAVTIDFEAAEQNLEADVYPPGTSDFTYPNVSTLTGKWLNSNGKAELAFTARSSGALPLLFRPTYGPGQPYDFTATVAHAVVLGLPALPGLTGTGTVAVGVHTADGGAIDNAGLTVTLQAKPQGAADSTWTSIGSATAVAGTATVSYQLPSALTGQLDVRATSQGAGYLSATSSAATVAGPPTPAPPVTPAPVPVVPTITRTISISYVRGHYRGRVSSKEKACYRRVPIYLYKRNGQPAVAHGTTRSDGSWTIKRKHFKKAYVLVAASSTPSLSCEAGVSKWARR